jgi:tetratricopeptide (TPR) repeat protein
MTRPRRNLALIVLFIAGAFFAAPHLPNAVLTAAAAVGAVLLIVAVFAAKHLLAGRALMKRGQWDDAALELAAFEHEQATVAWRRALAFLFVGTWTSDGVAVARGTLGAIRLEQGRLDEAEGHLKRAVEQDPGYALPYANLALVAARRADAAAAEAHRARAHQLGFRRRAFEQALAAALARKP